MTEKPFVVVAMSGGVDSSVAASLLVERGYRVAGMMLRLWSEPGTESANRCCTPDAMAQARKVAMRLGIPFYAIDVREPFRESVVQSFLDGYANGVTPNPCVVCNRTIRWGALYQQAMALGADAFATGHYARLRPNEQGAMTLLRGVDRGKDQSYVLSMLQQEQLRHTLFPIGEMEKKTVRDYAREHALEPAERPDSQDLCFLAGQDYRSFLKRFAPEAVRPGEIVTRSGQVIGTHDGLANYTIGQRKGLGIAAEHPLYVLGKDARHNRLVVGSADELGGDELEAGEVSWIAGSPPGETFVATVKIRYKAQDASAVVRVLPTGRVAVRFLHPLRDITPGQRAVFYHDEICLGGGTIL